MLFVSPTLKQTLLLQQVLDCSELNLLVSSKVCVCVGVCVCFTMKVEERMIYVRLCPRIAACTTENENADTSNRVFHELCPFQMIRCLLSML